MDVVAVHADAVVGRLDVALEAPEDGVVLELVRHARVVRVVDVDPADLDLGVAHLQAPEDDAADAAEPVDAYLDLLHVSPSLEAVPCADPAHPSLVGRPYDPYMTPRESWLDTN